MLAYIIILGRLQATDLSISDCRLSTSMHETAVTPIYSRPAEPNSVNALELEFSCTTLSKNMLQMSNTHVAMAFLWPWFQTDQSNLILGMNELRRYNTLVRRAHRAENQQSGVYPKLSLVYNYHTDLAQIKFKLHIITFINVAAIIF